MPSGSVEKAYWNKRQAKHYRQMVRGHKPLWDYVRQQVKDWDVQSILEVGCGLESPAKNLVPTYQGVDLNEQTDAIHEDFEVMDVEPWRGVDLFLSCGVIEHCRTGHEDFLLQVKELKPKHAIIGFFNTLDWTHHSRRMNARGYYHNVYSGGKLAIWLSNRGFKYQVIDLNRHDTVLVLGASGKCASEKRDYQI